MEDRLNENIYDIAIVGAGPSGATFARCLKEGLKVILIDSKSDTDNSFKKPCGGLLSPDAQKVLSQFNLNLPKDILVDPQIFSVKTIDLKTEIVRHYQRFYLNIDRHKFDMWLIGLIGKGIQKIKGKCIDITKYRDKEENVYKLNIKDEKGKKQIIYSKYLVGADGAKSIVRKKIYPNKKICTYMAIQQWFSNNDINPFYSCIFDSKTSDFVSWSISKNNYLIYGGAFESKNCRKNFELQKKRLLKYGFKLKNPHKTEACLVLRPKSFFDFLCGKENVFLTGEAAGYISRSSLEGISWAIKSGHILAEVFNKHYGTNNNLNRIYKKKTLYLRIRLFLKVIKSIAMYKEIFRKYIMKSGINTIKMISKENK